jgi:hypothetical protein
MIVASVCIAAFMLARPELVSITLGDAAYNGADHPFVGPMATLGCGLIFGLMHHVLTRPRVRLAFPSKRSATASDA